MLTVTSSTHSHTHLDGAFTKPNENNELENIVNDIINRVKFDSKFLFIGYQEGNTIH